MWHVRTAIRAVISVAAASRAMEAAMDPRDQKASRMAVRKSNTLLLYPAVLFICWIFGTINRIQNSVAPLTPIFTLTCLHYIFGGLQGKEPLLY